MPFPVQRIQTDRGQEFFAYIVQDYLKEHKIKFRPIKPLSPHLNGKVERSQKTDLDEFYSSVDIRSIELPKQLHNWGHTSLAGKTPWEKYQDLESSVPSIQEIEKNYDPLKEPLIMQNYKYNKELRNIIKLKKESSMIN